MNLIHTKKPNWIYNYTSTLVQSAVSPAVLYFIVIGNSILFVCAWLFYQVESGTNSEVNSFFDAVWWAFSTVTTVGYGDVIPKTAEGRVVGIVLMILGVVVFFSVTTKLISIFTSLTTKEVVRTEELTMTEYRNLMNKLGEIDSKIEKLSAGIDEKK